jgi:hypothetical protein
LPPERDALPEDDWAVQIPAMAFPAESTVGALEEEPVMGLLVSERFAFERFSS